MTLFFPYVSHQVPVFEKTYKGLGCKKIYINCILYRDNDDFVIWINDIACTSRLDMNRYGIHIIAIDPHHIVVTHHQKRFCLGVNQTLCLEKDTIFQGDARRHN